MNLTLRFFLTFLFFISSSNLNSVEEGVKTRFIKKFSEAPIGKELSLQVYIVNQRPHPTILVGHLNLPPGWSAVPTNDILIHLMPNQNVIQTVVIKIPDYQKEDELPLSYEVFARDNPNIYDKDEITLYIKDFNPFPKEEDFFFEDFIPLEESKEPLIENNLTFTITSEKTVETSQDKTFFISTLIKNSSDEIIEDTLTLSLPEGWQAVPSKEVDLKIVPNEPQLQIFGVKVAKKAIAGRYPLTLNFKKRPSLKDQLFVNIDKEPLFKLELVDQLSCYPLNQPIDLNLKYVNLGNTPLKVILEAIPNPSCPLIYRETAVEIPPLEHYLSRVRIEPDLSEDDDKQFIRLKVFNVETNEVIFQDTLTLSFTNPYDEDEDPYIRIDSEYTMMALGENKRKVLAFELAGAGYIDPEKGRFLEYVFRVPTTTKNVIYGVDQRLYVGVFEPGLDLNFGDTVYSLTPLTQRYRYGRGGGFDYESFGTEVGAHYTQNTYNNDYNPRETCCYLGKWVRNNLYFSGNYMFRDFDEEPKSNIFSLYGEYDWTDFEWTKRVHTEIEGGNDFLSHTHGHDTKAFRFDTRGQIFNDAWFDFEKIYAGSYFFGYYNHIDMYTGIIDFPFGSSSNCPMRANVSTTRLKQNFEDDDLDDDDDCDDYYAPKPRQRQYNGNISYNFLNGSSITLNGLLLRAKDVGEGEEYNFYQKWLGFTATYSTYGWNFLAITSWGNQKDYLTGKSAEFLQRYYCYASKNLTESIFSTLFFETGNTNYYDAKPWRTTVGGSIGYHYGKNNYMELFLQRVNNRVDEYELNQASFNLSHYFPNRHSLGVSAQYFQYKSHYPNDMLFLLSYTVPFGLPVKKRDDVGSLSGYVFDVESNTPIKESLVSLEGKQCYTDENGAFYFKNVKKGAYNLKTEILPKQMILKEGSSTPLNIYGGQTNEVRVEAISGCSITGEIVYYTFKDETIERLYHLGQPIEPSEMKKNPLGGIRVIISRNNGEEIYTALSNETGGFNFSTLRPGSWEIKIVKDQIPSLYELNMNEIVLNIEPREQKQILFKATPKRRSLQRLE